MRLFPPSPSYAWMVASSSQRPKRLRNAFLELAQGGHPRCAPVLDLEGVNFIDSQGAAKLTELHDLTGADGVTLRLARVKPQVLAVLQADGFVDRIGANHIHGSVHLAVEAQLAESGGA